MKRDVIITVVSIEFVKLSVALALQFIKVASLPDSYDVVIHKTCAKCLMLPAQLFGNELAYSLNRYILQKI